MKRRFFKVKNTRTGEILEAVRLQSSKVDNSWDEGKGHGKPVYSVVDPKEQLEQLKDGTFRGKTSGDVFEWAE